MFDLKRPCNNCPFRKSQGKFFQLQPDRLKEIFNAPSFECHKTTGVSGPKHKPQQCAGLMALLHKENKPNQIMQVANRLTGYTPDVIIADDIYDTEQDCLKGHNPP